MLNNIHGNFSQTATNKILVTQICIPTQERGNERSRSLGTREAGAWERGEVTIHGNRSPALQICTIRRM